MINFFNRCRDIILLADIEAKCLATSELYKQWQAGYFSFLTPTESIQSIPAPGAPKKPELISPLDVPKRKLGTKEGHAGLFHALAHIEFNAINLAIDACYRFQDMPIQFYANWLSVAKDEVYHFQLLNQHLKSLGYSYGDFSAHSGLWDMAVRTETDVLLRMALVPRVLEARGIDAVPELEKKVKSINDKRGAEILSIIHYDEIEHVRYGDYWFKYVCEMRSLDYAETFFAILEQYDAPRIRGAFNREGRKQAGFSDNELNQLLAR